MPKEKPVYMPIHKLAPFKNAKTYFISKMAATGCSHSIANGAPHVNPTPAC